MGAVAGEFAGGGATEGVVIIAAAHDECLLCAAGVVHLHEQVAGGGVALGECEPVRVGKRVQQVGAGEVAVGELLVLAAVGEARVCDAPRSVVADACLLLGDAVFGVDVPGAAPQRVARLGDAVGEGARREFICLGFAVAVVGEAACARGVRELGQLTEVVVAVLLGCGAVAVGGAKQQVARGVIGVGGHLAAGVGFGSGVAEAVVCLRDGAAVCIVFFELQPRGFIVEPGGCVADRRSFGALAWQAVRIAGRDHI